MVTRKHSSKSKNQTGPKRSPNEILRDRALVAKLNLEGLTLEKIAQELGKVRPYALSLQTIANDLKAVKASWMSSGIQDYGKTKQIELARIDEDEQRAIDAWEQSKKTKKRYESGSNGDTSFNKTIEEDQCGNPAFLAAIDRCRARRCSILGFNAVQKSEDVNAAIVTLLQFGYEIKKPGGEE